jgi:hypothetical protein
MPMNRHAIMLGSFLLCIASAATAGEMTLVICAPGYPGNSEQAQPVMDDLAAALGGAMAGDPDYMGAVYHNELDAGLARLSEEDAVAALVPLPFYLRYRKELGLRPLAQALPISGPTESWSLVAHRGAIGDVSSLEGWEITGMPGYAPAFVREVAFPDWGKIPESVPIRFTARAVSALRKAAAGEKLAVLLDGAQSESLPALPFSSELEVVASSRPLPTSLVCALGERLSKDDAAELVSALLGLGETESGRELLASLRMTGFEQPDEAAIERLELAFDGSAE